MFKHTHRRQCLICNENIDDVPNLFCLVYHPTICHNCLQLFEVIECQTTLNKYPLTILYKYNSFFKQQLMNYKANGDIALCKVFINQFPFLKSAYRHHVVVTVPSSQEDNTRRGFNPNLQIARNFSDNIFTGLYKTSNYKQTSHSSRQEVKKHIAIKHGSRLTNKRVLLFDDVITSGSSLQACIELIKPYKPKSIEILVLATNQISSFFN